MKREQRAVFLAILTWLIYGFSVLLDKNRLIFPFPLNEIAFLIVTIYLLRIQWRTANFQKWIVLSVALFQLISTQFYWTFFLNSEWLEQLTKSVLLDFLRIIYFLSVFIWLFYSLFGLNIKFKLPILFLLFFSLFFAFYHHLLWLESLTFLVVGFMGYLKKTEYPFYLLWVLLAVFDLFKLLTLTT